MAQAADVRAYGAMIVTGLPRAYNFLPTLDLLEFLPLSLPHVLILVYTILGIVSFFGSTVDLVSFALLP